MIDAGDFLKWLQVFQVYRGGVVPPAIPGPGGDYTAGQVITPVAGMTGSAVKVSALYLGNTTDAGGIITATTIFQVIADGSGDPIVVQLTNPVNGNYSATDQVTAQSFWIRKVINPANGDGNFVDLTSIIAGGVQFTFAAALPGVEYRIGLSYVYQIQA